MVKYSQDLLEVVIMWQKVWSAWRKLRHPPPLFKVVLIILIADVLIWFIYNPNINKSGDGILIFFMFVGFFTALMIILMYKGHRCDIFSGPVRKEVYDSAGNFLGFRPEDEICGKKAIGRIEAICRNRRVVLCFCKDHDPDIGWMKEWLRKRQIEIIPYSLKTFPPEDDNGDDNSQDFGLKPKF